MKQHMMVVASSGAHVYLLHLSPDTMPALDEAKMWLSVLCCMPVLVWQQYHLIICTKVSVCKPVPAPQVTEFHHLSVLVPIECLPDSLLPSLFPFLFCHSNMIYRGRPPDLRGSAPYDSLASYAPVRATVAGKKWCVEITYFTHKNQKKSCMS